MPPQSFPDQSPEDGTTSRLFEAISHPRRIKILQHLATSPASFSDLKHVLQLSSSGNLTHHLHKLEDLVRHHRSGTYELTPQGREALLSIAIAQKSRRKILQESYTWFSATIFYAIFLTIAYYTDPGCWWIPFLGLICTGVYFGGITWLVRRKVNKGDWFLLFGRHR